MALQLTIRQEDVGPWTMQIVAFKRESASLELPVIGFIGNSVPSPGRGKQRLEEWKRAVASAAKQRRGSSPWDSRLTYAITVGFAFNARAHGYQPRDVENFLKPCIDALAAGLFCPDEQDATKIKRYDYDDSNFRYLFFQRLPDAPHESDEGAALCVSVSE